MKIISAQFKGSFAHLDQLPADSLPEIAFSGRSNVGKSSLINCLLNRKKLALTSSTPGKTRLLNYYLINEAFYFVDLPGYGFAKVSHAERQKWKTLLESYFEKNKKLVGIVQIIDSRHDITNLDREMLALLQYLKLPLILVATKADKITNSKKLLLAKKIRHEFLAIQLNNIIIFSTLSKEGKKEIWQSIQALLNIADG
jgi:GTP-binding protein